MSEDTDAKPGARKQRTTRSERRRPSRRPGEADSPWPQDGEGSGSLVVDSDSFDTLDIDPRPPERSGQGGEPARLDGSVAVPDSFEGLDGESEEDDDTGATQEIDVAPLQLPDDDTSKTLPRLRLEGLAARIAALEAAEAAAAAVVSKRPASNARASVATGGDDDDEGNSRISVVVQSPTVIVGSGPDRDSNDERVPDARTLQAAGAHAAALAAAAAAAAAAAQTASVQQAPPMLAAVPVQHAVPASAPVLPSILAVATAPAPVTHAAHAPPAPKPIARAPEPARIEPPPVVAQPTPVVAEDAFAPAAEAEVEAEAEAELDELPERQSSPDGDLMPIEVDDEEEEVAELVAGEQPRTPPPPPPPDARNKAVAAPPRRPPPPPVSGTSTASAPAAPAVAAPAVPAVPPASTAGRTEDERQKRKQIRQWWERFFSEDYLMTVLPPTVAQISSQVDFITASLGLERGATILDVGCGLGLHSIELSRRGFLVVGLDLSLAMITRAAESAQRQGLKINFVHADIREMEFDGAFDAVVCLGTTFGFFDDDANRDVLVRLHQALRPGGRMLLDVVNRDYVMPLQPNLVWFEGDECVVMEESDFNYFNSRLSVKRTMMREDGRQSQAEYAIRLYSLHEIGLQVQQMGFRVMEVSGQEAVRGAFFGAQSPRILMLAERRAPGRASTVLPPERSSAELPRPPSAPDRPSTVELPKPPTKPE